MRFARQRHHLGNHVKEIHDRHEEWLHDNEYSQLEIMKNTPILEINCNSEFKNCQRKKSEMLRAVKGFIASLQAAKKPKPEDTHESSHDVETEELSEDVPIATVTSDQNKLPSNRMDDSGVFSRTNTPTLEGDNPMAAIQS